MSEIKRVSVLVACIETMGEATSVLKEFMFRGLNGLAKVQSQGVSSATFLRLSSQFVEKYAHVQNQLLLPHFKVALHDLEIFLIENEM
jgi:hypothetical protein